MKKDEAIRLLSDVKHPAIDRTLLDLGIIKYISSDEDIVYITLAFPFPEIPIADTLVELVSAPIRNAGSDVRVDMVLMTEEEKQQFLRMEKEAWKGLEE